jgi:hypothetical protein
MKGTQMKGTQMKRAAMLLVCSCAILAGTHWAFSYGCGYYEWSRTQQSQMQWDDGTWCYNQLSATCTSCESTWDDRIACWQDESYEVTGTLFCGGSCNGGTCSGGQAVSGADPVTCYYCSTSTCGS